MNDIFKKLEEAKVNTLALIAEGDKNYCIKLFEQYKAHVKFIQHLLQLTVDEWDDHQREYKITRDDFLYEMDKMDNILESYQQILSGLHERIIRLVESHFKTTYNLDFISYNDEHKPAEVILHESLEVVINSMVQQVGSDLSESGKSQVIKRFQKLFTFPRQQPELKNNRITFPMFYSLGYGSAVSLSYEDQNFLALLHAIALVVYDTAVLPEIFNQQYNEWKEEIEYNKPYLLQADISIKFFKNRRVDLCLPSAHTTEKFWQLFQLETIILSNNNI